MIASFTHVLQILHQVVVDVEIFPGDLVPREDLREASVDSGRRRGHKADIRVRRDGHKRRVPHSPRDLFAQDIPVEPLVLASLRYCKLFSPRSFESCDRIDGNLAL
jgi:hypothetical protein